MSKQYPWGVNGDAVSGRMLQLQFRIVPSKEGSNDGILRIGFMGVKDDPM